MSSSMHGARIGHEVLDVSVEHVMQMEVAVKTPVKMAAISIDWKGFFDSLEKIIGNELKQKRMTQDSVAILTLKAEQSFTEKARNRFKVGKALEPEGKTRTNGFNQGPNYSIEVALSFMAVWTQLQEEEAKVKTGGFIDDSSVRTLRGDSEKTILEKIVKSKQLSLEFCTYAGTKLNYKKTKALATDEDLESQIQEVLKEDGIICSKAVVLVGGLITNGRRNSKKEREQLHRPRIEKYQRILDRINQTPLGLEGREALMIRFAGKVLTWNSWCHRMYDQALENISWPVHRILHGGGKVRWQLQAATFIFSTKGHLIAPWMATRHDAIKTMRRIFQKRGDLRKLFGQYVAMDEQNGRHEKDDSFGPCSVLCDTLEDVGWSINSKLVIQRRNGGQVHLVEGEDALFSHILREDIRRKVLRKSRPLKNREEFQGLEKGADYETTVHYLRNKTTKMVSNRGP